MVIDALGYFNGFFGLFLNRNMSYGIYGVGYMSKKYMRVGYTG